MAYSEKQLLNAILRSDFESVLKRSFMTLNPGEKFLPNWHHRVLARELMRCLKGENRRLIITLPPRNLKSLTASVAFPAYALGLHPTLNIICVSYAADLAAKFSRDTRLVMESRWYRDAFSDQLDPRKQTQYEITTKAHGGRLATSTGGVLTGRGGNIIIIDDPLNADDAYSEVKRQAVNDWYGNVLISRLNNKAEDVIIVVAQRLHDEDLVGQLLRSDEEWVHLNLPAIAEEAQRFELDGGVIVGRDAGEVLHETLEPESALLATKRTMGSHAFDAQYQQDPTPLEGGMINWTWFNTYTAPLTRQDGDFVTQSWDTASKATELSDYSVCTTWLLRENDHFLVDVFRDRLEYPKLKRKVVTLADRYDADTILVEDKGSGTSLIQDLPEDGEVRPIPILPEADKQTRMFHQTAKIEAGYVWLPETASWLEDFQRELLQFPSSKHDDQIDSVSQYLGWENPGRGGTWEFRFESNSVLDELNYEPGACQRGL